MCVAIVREYPELSPARYYSMKQDATFLWLNSQIKVHARYYVRILLSNTGLYSQCFHSFVYNTLLCTTRARRAKVSYQSFRLNSLWLNF